MGKLLLDSVNYQFMSLLILNDVQYFPMMLYCFHSSSLPWDVGLVCGIDYIVQNNDLNTSNYCDSTTIKQIFEGEFVRMRTRNAGHLLSDDR